MTTPIRPTGLTNAAAALRFWERRQEVLANNLANVSTDTFKAERTFARLSPEGVPVIDRATDRRDGTMRVTGAPLDVAIEGDGFLVVDTPAGERLSRGGALRLDDASRLTDAQGHPLLGEQGTIVLPPGDVHVAVDGTVSVAGRAIDRLRMETVPAGAPLQHEGGTLVVPPATRAGVAPAERRLRQGVIEESNVNPLGAMVDMITTQRSYAALQRVVTTIDGVHGTIANDLGKPV